MQQATSAGAEIQLATCKPRYRLDIGIGYNSANYIGYSVDYKAGIAYKVLNKQ